MDKVDVTIYVVTDAKGNKFSTVADPNESEQKFFINDAIKEDGSKVSFDYTIYVAEQWADENGFQFDTFQTQLPLGRLNPAMDAQSFINKERARGALERETERIKKERAIRDLVGGNSVVDEVTIISDDIAIVKSRIAEKDRPVYDDNEFLYQAVVNGHRIVHVSYDFDSQLLRAIGYKYDGLNSQFADFAVRMLKIKQTNK